MTAKRLPSGNYRCQVYSHTTSAGKRVYESFTAPTKQEAEAKAIAYRQKRQRIMNKDLTVGEAVRKYIEVNDGTLSESTIAGYTRYLPCVDKIGHLRIQNLSQDELQAFVSTISQKHKPKYVKNIMALIKPAVKMFRPDVELRYNLPQHVRKKTRVPNDDEIARLMQAANRRMKLCIALGCSSMRRAEICAVQLKDVCKVDDGLYKIDIHRDCVKDKNGKWVYRDVPKTEESDRYVHIPQAAYDLIDAENPEDLIVDILPNSITQGFDRLTKRLGINMTFHTTRHYYASMMAYLGVPDFATAEMGGWKHVDQVMKEIYQGVSEEKRRQFLSAGTNHLGKIFSENT